MVKGQSDKHGCRPPDCDDFGHNLTCGDGKIDGQADEPVGTYSAKEDLVPVRVDGLLFGEVEDRLLVHRFVVHSSIYWLGQWNSLHHKGGELTACDDCHKEQRPCKIAEEGNNPAFQKVNDRDTTMQECCCHELTRQPYHNALVAVAHTMTLEVKRSDPVSTIITSPTGNSNAPTMRMRPGAFS